MGKKVQFKMVFSFQKQNGFGCQVLPSDLFGGFK